MPSAQELLAQARSPAEAEAIARALARLGIGGIGAAADDNSDASYQRGQLATVHIYRPDNVVALSGTAGSISSPYRIDFSSTHNQGSRVVGMAACTLNGTAAELYGTSVRVQLNGQEDLFTTGQASQYLNLGIISPTNAPWFVFAKPIPIRPGDSWFCTFKNEAGTITPTPVVAFKVVS